MLVSLGRISKDGSKSLKTNKWQNLKTMAELIDGLIIPYLNYCRTLPELKEEFSQYPNLTFLVGHGLKYGGMMAMGQDGKKVVSLKQCQTVKPSLLFSTISC